MMHIKLIIGVLLISECFAKKYQDNSSRYLSPSMPCRSSLCSFVERFHSYNSPRLALRYDSDTNLARSYYGYGTPAFYSTFDPISVLASLAFLAFLLQSFMSLFDRSRSMIPTIVTNRSVPRNQIPDPIELIMQALDEYEIFDNVPDKKERGKT
ncbi:uncharacterized protein LOC123267440 [Cotesia glomerata]|uniref:Uncharacterized protein n=1 Tax=Cotesia glomerata TaxID=32391 RepID=A0AAV7HT49_COTGL|nr:uncharacterized protein LOC123267440 [Cotesia glomerata]KAH0535275.1 hypothetical protein KQX54_015668 [Cotesia glomerata]